MESGTLIDTTSKVKDTIMRRRSETIAIVAIVLNVVVWSVTFIGARIVYTEQISNRLNAVVKWVDKNEDIPAAVANNALWINRNRDVSACAKANSEWIDRNAGMPNAVMKNGVSIDYIVKTMDKIVSQYEELNRHLVYFINNAVRTSENGHKNNKD